VDVGIVDHLLTLHPCRNRTVYDDRADQIAHIGRLSSGRIDPDSEVTHLLQKLLGAVDDCGDYLSRDQLFVPADGRGE